METKLYYQDAYIQEFTARIVKQEKDAAGNWFIVLNQTAFYPTGGGQPHDLGTINDKRVTNVEEIEGEIRHYLESAIEDTSSEAVCMIDWERRFDHMQQHTGQHILSAAFDHLFQYKTIGFHLGAEAVTIDLETENLTESEVREAEKLANQIILENRPIEVKWVTEDELSQYSLRKETKVKEDIRLVIIPDFDYNGCGGTHPLGTGEVAAIKILDWERQKKKLRLQFVCGNRVIKQLGEKQKILLHLTKLLNSPEKEMEQAVIRLLENGKDLEKALSQTKENLLHFEAQDLLAKTGDEKIIGVVFEERTIQELQKLARLVTAEEEQALVFFVSTNGTQVQLVFARGTRRTESMKEVAGKILPLINGKGGGNDSFAQGGGADVMPAEQILQQILTIIK